MKKKVTTGFVIGKFMPLHVGHELLINFAKGFVDKLYVLVDNVPKDKYPGKHIPEAKRVEWIKDIIPNVEVIALPQPTLQDPDESPDFWEVWMGYLNEVLPEKPDYFIASATYGYKLAKLFGSEFIPLDYERDTIKMSATEIRENFDKNWGYLSPMVRKDFTLSVCIFGPESTGKSTLTNELAKHYDTIAIPEYARFYLEIKKQHAKEEGMDYWLTYDDMYKIARGQVAIQEAFIPRANKIAFTDTDALLTTIWSKWLFEGKIDKEIFKLAEKQTFELYLLTKPDISFKEEEFIRYFPNQDDRNRFFEDCKKLLEEHNKSYVIVDGRGEERSKSAIEAIDKLMKEKFTYGHFVEKLNK